MPSQARSWVRSTDIVGAAILTVLVIGMLYWARTIIIPLALAVFLSFILAPSASLLRKMGIGRVNSIVIVVGVALVVVALVGWVVTSQINGLIQELPDHSDRIRGKLTSLNGLLASNPQSGFGKVLRDLEDVLKPPSVAGNQPVPVVVHSGQPGWLSGVWTVTGPLIEGLAHIALTFLLAVFMLLNREDMRNRLLRLIGPRNLTAATKAMDDAGARISRYLRVQLFINSAFGLILVVLFAVIGLPFAILWGIFAGLMRYVPYIGAWIGLAPPLLASLVLFEGWSIPIAVVAGYAMLEFALNSLIEPRLLGHSLGMSEVALIFSAAFWAFLWGPIGLVLSGPLTACLLVLGKNVPQLRSLEVLLGVEEPLPADVRFYQRLAARDRDEARQIAIEFTAANAVEATRDSLIVPALGRAQQALEDGELPEHEAEALIDASREIAEELELLPSESEIEPSQNNGNQLTVLGVCASGPTNAVILEMLAARLDSDQWKMEIMQSGTLASDLLARVRELNPATVLLSAGAPSPTAHIRYLCKRLRMRYPQLRIYVGRWSNNPIDPIVRSELAAVGADDMTNQIPLAVQYLQASREPLTIGRIAKPNVNGETAESQIKVHS